MNNTEEAAKAAKAAIKKSPARVALIDKYLAIYPAAKRIRSELIADNAMDGSKIADAVRKFMDSEIGA